MTEAQRDHILVLGPQLREALMELENACIEMSDERVSECMDDVHDVWDNLIEGTDDD